MARTDPRPNQYLSPLRPDGESASEPGPERKVHLAEGVPLAEILPRTLIKAADLVVLNQPRSVAAEKFRRMKTKLFHEFKDELRVMVVTSAAPNEGKSLVAMNLALAYAEDGTSTLLIDADLRRPTLQKWISPAPSLGLRNVIDGDVGVSHALVHIKSSVLTLLPGGEAVNEPAPLFAGEAFRGLVQDMRGCYSMIIIDTPPIVPFSDADVIGGSADGIVLAARAGQTLRSAFTQALSLVTSSRILGIVLNDVKRSLADHGHYHDHYYDRYYQKDGGRD